MIPKSAIRHFPSTNHACATTASSGASLRDCVESFRVLAEAHPDFACQLRELTVSFLLDGSSGPAPQWVAGTHPDVQELVARLSSTSHVFSDLDPAEKWDLVDLALQELPRTTATSPAWNTCYMHAAIRLVAATPELLRIVTTSKHFNAPMRDACQDYLEYKSPACLERLYSTMVELYGGDISTARNQQGDTRELLSAVFKDQLLQFPASEFAKARYHHAEPGIVYAEAGTTMVDVFSHNEERATGALVYFGSGKTGHYRVATKDPWGHWFLWNEASPPIPIPDIRTYLDKNEKFVVGLMLDGGGGFGRSSDGRVSV